jgi:hypothetical protein
MMRHAVSLGLIDEALAVAHERGLDVEARGPGHTGRAGVAPRSAKDRLAHHKALIRFQIQTGRSSLH